MTRLLLLLAVALLGASSRVVSEVAMTLVVEAEVVTPAQPVPPAGIVHALQVDRYRVLRVVKGSYSHRVLFAAREAGTPFKAGERLLLTLSSELPKDAAPLVTEPEEVARVGLFYCLEFERLQ